MNCWHSSECGTEQTSSWQGESASENLGTKKKKIEFIEKQLFLQQNDNEMAILFRKLIFSNGQVPVALATPHRVESRVVKAEKTFMTKPF